MKKINTKSILLSLGTLAILAFGVTAIPEVASAQYYGGNNGYQGGTSADAWPNGYGSNNGQSYQAPIYVQNVAPAPTPTIYSNSTNPDQGVKKRNPAPAKTVAPEPETSVDTGNDLAASAIFGSDSIMPKTFMGWILFAILVLFIVILVRRIYGGGEKYYAVPMKHK